MADNFGYLCNYEEDKTHLKKMFGDKYYSESSYKYLRTRQSSWWEIQPDIYLKEREYKKEGKIELPPYFSFFGVKCAAEEIEIENDNKETKKLKTDFALGFFGLIMQLGPIANWGLNLNKKTVEVDTEKFETNQKGIYAVGDICNYPGKLKLILSGFHEGALAARACFKLARPNEKYRFEFTTSSKTIKNRLGVKGD